MPDYYSENSQNAEIILNFLKESEAKTVLDICCGAFDDEGTNYDNKGQIYKPLVAQILGKNGFEVTGIDFRANKTMDQIYYQHTTGVDILKSNWAEKFSNKFEVVIFLRSWDTPEILLNFQDKFPHLSLNELSIKIAQGVLFSFLECVKEGGFFITTEIFNYGLCEDTEEINKFKKQTLEIFKQYKFNLLKLENGIYFLRKN
jgi:hypothetical protein